MERSYVKRSLLLLTVFAAVFYCADFREIIGFGKNVMSYPTEGISAYAPENGKITVVIDSGHGGNDPGKVGIHGEKEKDINLAIAKKLQRNLEHQGFHVMMTRTDDNGLYSEGSENKKREDMKRRIEMMNTSGAVLAVSIHQNSFTDSRYKGAQTFYYKTSEKSRGLAQYIQESLIENADGENTRQAKENDSYYILKKSEIPAVIVECGFLSNEEEAAKLCDENYQEKLAWAIHIGIVQWLAAF